MAIMHIAIIIQTDKRSGITYAYKAEYVWDIVKAYRHSVVVSYLCQLLKRLIVI